MGAVKVRPWEVNEISRAWIDLWSRIVEARCEGGRYATEDWNREPSLSGNLLLERRVGPHLHDDAWPEVQQFLFVALLKHRRAHWGSALTKWRRCRTTGRLLYILDTVNAGSVKEDESPGAWSEWAGGMVMIWGMRDLNSTSDSSIGYQKGK